MIRVGVLCLHENYRMNNEHNFVIVFCVLLSNRKLTLPLLFHNVRLNVQDIHWSDYEQFSI